MPNRNPFALSRALWVCVVFLCLAATPSTSDPMVPTIGLYGTPGLLDMPTAESAPDAQLSNTLSYFGGTTRSTITFQITPKLSGSFRYSALNGIPTGGINTLFDRSFDLHYRLASEGRFRPSLAVGLRDLIGTGVYASEYFVATKHIGQNLKFTGGIGWGRLGGVNSFTNPFSRVFGSGFNTRTASTGLGGVPKFGNWFHGPASFFGGVEWRTPIDRLTFKAEYSSDAYIRETVTNSMFARRTPLNFGLTYKFRNGNELSGYYMYGSEIGISGSIILNPKNPPAASSIGQAPMPVLVRADDNPHDTSWTAQSDGPSILKANIQTLLSQDGQKLEALSVTATRVEIRFRNLRHEAPAQAIGRVARILTQTMPSSVEQFVIIPVEKGMPVVAVLVNRSDVERLENAPDGATEILKYVKFEPATNRSAGAQLADGLYPKLSWKLGPYAAMSFFDPDRPLRVDLGARLEGTYEISPGLVLSGSVKKRVIGNLNTVTRISNSVMRHVRSDYGLYDNAGDPALEYLTAEYFFKPARNIYGRLSFGYLEKMYGGLSAEALWRPVDSKLAFGAEINVVKQRAFNQLFGFQPYSVVTGHVSGYWDIGNGYATQVDVGRYLAGDWGSTVTIDRTFDNGWKVGAFFTITNVPFSTFGEGSFDKGLRFTVPLSWLTGKPSRTENTLVMRPVTRDGGARLEVRNRLYGLTERYQGPAMKRRWGRFWR